ncbi:MAG TPA: M28 family peptidase, partial [Vicinamibacteria bacterium]
MILVAAVLAATSATFLGFRPERADVQRALEARFDQSLRAENLREWMRRLSARPHHVGSPYGRQNAEFIAAQFRSWGYETRIEEFEVLFPTPRQRVLEMTAPRPFRARLAEPPLPEDATSGQTAEQLPVYNAYSVDGDVSGELVYVNYGVPADYEELDRRGIDVKGKVVIARYGGSWRGIKPKVAAERGAVGCILYSDPRDDGFFRGDPYPRGPWRSEHGAQRGSVKDAPLYSGDPLTPGVGATRDAKRLPLSEAHTLTRIPVLPVSWSDAQPLLQALEGPVAPEGWRGALPLTYHLGPGPARVRLALAFDWKMVTAHDVIAVLRGREKPDEWILRGNHHDAWVNGAKDPVSGMVALMEEARAVAALRGTGWAPRRTLVYAAWDAEEQGLIGSTEWAETHAEELRRRAVAYVNSDSNGRGFLEAGGSHSLEALVNEVAESVEDPATRVSVRQRLRALRWLSGAPDARKEAHERKDLRIDALGSGSDYTPFLQHLGIASLNLGFGGEDDGGSYHSIYDSFDHYTRFGDPSFEYGIALVQTAGRVVLRCAAAEALPFQFGRLAATFDRYAKEVAK